MSIVRQKTFASLPRTQRGCPLVLNGDPKGNNFLYTNGNNVYIRNIEDPSICDVYAQHSTTVNVAKFSPSGFYIASADSSGKVRIWDTVNAEHILKNEYQPFAGEICDLSWSPDSQRIVVAGNGRERFGHVFMADTGTSVGEIFGQSKKINSCDYRPARPFRIITGSEDNSVGFFEGPPFKFKCTLQSHSRYVQSVRFSPDGNLFASAGFDGKIFLCEGATAAMVGELGSPAHKGGVYAVSWSPDGRHILSASGDKTCKVFDVETRQAITEFTMGKTVEDQQLGCLWQGDHLLAVGLSGFITYLDRNNSAKPVRVIKGHNKPITALATSTSSGCGPEVEASVFTGCSDGHVTRWFCPGGETERVSGAGHGSIVRDATVTADSTQLITVGYDDSLRQICPQQMTYGGSVPLGGQPRAVAAAADGDGGGRLLAVATQDTIMLVTPDGQRKAVLSSPGYQPLTVAYCGHNRHLAVGSDDTQRVTVYSVSGDRLEKRHELPHQGAVVDAAFSPDGKFLVACDSLRRVILYNVADNYKVANPREWGFHTARVNCVAWSPDSRLVASGGLDTNIIVWNALEPSKHVKFMHAHDQSQVTRLQWLSNTQLVSTGQDCNVRFWQVQL